jgi:hypothetical protein
MEPHITSIRPRRTISPAWLSAKSVISYFLFIYVMLYTMHNALAKILFTLEKNVKKRVKIATSVKTLYFLIQQV